MLKEEWFQLTKYHDRQVIINYFEEDGIVDRKGFFFDSIEIENEQIHFLKEGNIFYSLPSPCTITKLHGFSNHYSLGEGEDRVEIYFPN